MNTQDVQLVVYKSIPAQCWMVKHLNDPETTALMGTTDVPSAFTPEAPATRVKQELQRLNPHCSILLLEHPGVYWKISEAVEQHKTTELGWMLRQFLLSLAGPHDGINLKRLFSTCPPEQRQLVLEALNCYTCNPQDPELRVCMQWMHSIDL